MPPDRPPGCTARHVGRPRGARPLHTGPMGPLGPCRAHGLALVASRWVMRTEIGRGGASGPGGPGWGSLLWRCRMTQRTRRGGSWWHLAPQGSPLGHWGGYCAFRGPAIAHTGAQTARVSSVFHRGATRVVKNPVSELRPPDRPAQQPARPTSGVPFADQVGTIGLRPTAGLKADPNVAPQAPPEPLSALNRASHLVLV